MPIKTSSAKAKGRELQKHVVARVKEVFPWLKGDDVVSRPMGSGGSDLILSPYAIKTLPISFECKKTKKTPSRGELDQSTANVYEDTIPCVVWCPHGKGHNKSMIMFDLDEFLLWFKKHRENI